MEWCMWVEVKWVVGICGVLFKWDGVGRQGMWEGRGGGGGGGGGGGRGGELMEDRCQQTTRTSPVMRAESSMFPLPLTHSLTHKHTPAVHPHTHFRVRARTRSMHDCVPPFMRQQTYAAV